MVEVIHLSRKIEKSNRFELSFVIIHCKGPMGHSCPREEQCSRVYRLGTQKRGLAGWQILELPAQRRQSELNVWRRSPGGSIQTQKRAKSGIHWHPPLGGGGNCKRGGSGSCGVMEVLEVAGHRNQHHLAQARKNIFLEFVRRLNELSEALRDVEVGTAKLLGAQQGSVTLGFWYLSKAVSFFYLNTIFLCSSVHLRNA